MKSRAKKSLETTKTLMGESSKRVNEAKGDKVVADLAKKLFKALDSEIDPDDFDQQDMLRGYVEDIMAELDGALDDAGMDSTAILRDIVKKL